MANELNLLDIATILIKRRKAIVLHFCSICLVALAIAFLLPKTYKASLSFIPSSASSASSLLSMFGGNIPTDVLGGAQLSKRQYKALLLSREVREVLIKEFGLIKVYKKAKSPNPLDATLKALKKTIAIEEEEEGGLGITDVIQYSISVEDENPKRAADMANRLFELLEEKVVSIDQNDNRKTFEFLTRQMASYTVKLNESRARLNGFQRSTRTYSLPEQMQLVFKSYAMLNAEITSLDNEIDFISASTSASNPELQLLKSRKRSLEEKLISIEFTKDSTMFPGISQSLTLSNEYADLLLDVETNLQIVGLLKQQIEQVQIKLAKNYTNLYLIDHARTPEYKDKPKRAFVILGIVVFYMGTLLVWILASHFLPLAVARNPEAEEKISALFQEFRKR